MDTTTAVRLDEEQLQAYHRDGYVVVENLVSSDEVEALGRRLRQYTHEDRPPGKIKIQVEPRVESGELRVEHPGDGIR